MKSLNSNITQIEKFARAQSAMDEFANRLGDNVFHGGERPDACDFRVYSIVARYRHTFTVKKLLN